MEKKFYAKPVLTVHGDVAAITQANFLGSRADGSQLTILGPGGQVLAQIPGQSGPLPPA